MNQYRMRRTNNVKKLADAYKEEIVQHITRNLLARAEEAKKVGETAEEKNRLMCQLRFSHQAYPFFYLILHYEVERALSIRVFLTFFPSDDIGALLSLERSLSSGL
jgi:hypothetical protein